MLLLSLIALALVLFPLPVFLLCLHHADQKTNHVDAGAFVLASAAACSGVMVLGGLLAVILAIVYLSGA